MRSLAAMLAGLTAGLLLQTGITQAQSDPTSDNAAKNLVVGVEVAANLPMMLWFNSLVDPTAGPFPRSITGVGTYDDLGWTLAFDGDYLGRSLFMNFVGTLDSSSNSVSWAGNGTYGSEPIMSSGIATFSGVEDEFMSYRDHVQIGTSSWVGIVTALEAFSSQWKDKLKSPLAEIVSMISPLAVEATKTDPPPPPAPPVQQEGVIEETVNIKNVAQIGVANIIVINKPVQQNQPRRKRASLDGTGSYTGNEFAVTMQVVPEPATMLLLGSGLAGVAGVARRRRRKESEQD